MDFYADGASPKSREPIHEAVQTYLLTGESDPLYYAWPGDLMERAHRAHEDLRGALIGAVRERSAGLSHQPVPDSGTVALTRAKVEPMVRGLFPRAEQDQVLATLERSVVFLTRVNIESILLAQRWDRSAWTIANLYLSGAGARLLGDDAPHLAGLSEETTCYVSPDYFAEDDSFADFIVHEVAHIFHNCKRATIGLPETRAKVWLLDIDYGKRETFAYSCEAYARIVERGMNPVERRALAEEYGRSVRIFDERVDPSEVARVVQEAAWLRNGWKVILARCAPKRRRPLEVGREQSAKL